LIWFERKKCRKVGLVDKIKRRINSLFVCWKNHQKIINLFIIQTMRVIFWLLFCFKKIVLFFAVKVVGWVCGWVVNWEQTKDWWKKKQRRIKDDEIDNLVQLNRDKFQSSTLNYLTKPNQTKQVSFFLIFSFHLIDVLFDSFTFLKFNWLKIELIFRFKSQLCFSNLPINCDNSPTHQLT